MVARRPRSPARSTRRHAPDSIGDAAGHTRRTKVTLIRKDRTFLSAIRRVRPPAGSEGASILAELQSRVGNGADLDRRRRRRIPQRWDPSGRVNLRRKPRCVWCTLHGTGPGTTELRRKSTSWATASGRAYHPHCRDSRRGRPQEHGSVAHKRARLMTNREAVDVAVRFIRWVETSDVEPGPFDRTRRRLPGAADARGMRSRRRGDRARWRPLDTNAATRCRTSLRRGAGLTR
jgi:hypothetical protein